MPALASHLKDWLQAHMTLPRRISLSTDPDGLEHSEFWLVTDHTVTNDSSYRVVYDDREGMFGIECTLENGVHWMMGLYGGLAETIENM